VPIAALDSAITNVNGASLTYGGASRVVLPMQRGFFLASWWYFCWQVSQAGPDDDDPDGDEDDPFVPWWRVFREDKITLATELGTQLPWPAPVHKEFSEDLKPMWWAESIVLDVRDYIPGFWHGAFGFTPGA